MSGTQPQQTAVTPTPTPANLLRTSKNRAHRHHHHHQAQLASSSSSSDPQSAPGSGSCGTVPKPGATPPPGAAGPASGSPPHVRVNVVAGYQMGQVIGRGACGVVYKAVDVKTGEFVAVKQVKTSANASQAAEKEINILSRLSHPNIIRVIGTHVEQDTLSIILEYADGGSLAGILDKFGPLPETLVATYIDQVLTGLDYLHSQMVLHRDIKGGNILISADGTAKISDFGVSAVFAKTTKRLTVVGTPYWMSPETIQMDGQTDASDIWSLGATIIELLTGFPPYHMLSPMGAMFHIVQDQLPPLPSDISNELHDFLVLCFQKEQTDRPPAAALKTHLWLREKALRSSKAPSVGELVDNVQDYNAIRAPTPESPLTPSQSPTVSSMLNLESVVTPREAEFTSRLQKLEDQLHLSEKKRLELRKELEDCHEEIEELKKTLRANASAEKTSQEFFWNLAMAIKTTALERGQPCATNIQPLYEKAVAQDIPWNLWVEWLPSMLMPAKKT
ncbi:STE/STE11/CDC15 protein kinase [Pelomyxa schiedti]|nr:STE/STE11/CDC15 protein kinase [Pelomyxa schiedti]